MSELINNDVLANFKQALAAYNMALFGGGLSSNHDRESAAYQFREWIQKFKEVGSIALPILEIETESQDVYRRNAAVRLLIEMDDV
ncbi:MAG: hypothetical protein H7Y11_06390, partial [Armatimonadetes bacterium]|nr:hypothetical protein [Anaerolineae bacterium]